MQKAHSSPVILLFIFLLLAPGAFAHGGRLNEHGGHVDSKTGYFHCHTSACFERYGEDTAPVAAEGGAPFVTLYDREEWPHWRDLDGDCLNTRDETLVRDSLVPVQHEKGDKCDVQAGLWEDPYTGKRHQEATALSIDHVVPLRWAHGHGGDRWSRRVKEEFANDPDNLLVVESGVNSAKGAKGPDDWLPPREAYHCAYLERFIAVMKKYALRFVEVERAALAKPLERCGF